MLAELTIELTDKMGLGILLALSTVVGLLTYPSKQLLRARLLNVIRFPFWCLFIAIAVLLYAILYPVCLALYARKNVLCFTSIVVAVSSGCWLCAGTPTTRNPLWFLYGFVLIVASLTFIGEMHKKYKSSAIDTADRVLSFLNTVEPFIRGNMMQAPWREKL